MRGKFNAIVDRNQCSIELITKTRMLIDKQCGTVSIGNQLLFAAILIPFDQMLVCILCQNSYNSKHSQSKCHKLLPMLLILNLGELIDESISRGRIVQTLF